MLISYVMFTFALFMLTCSLMTNPTVGWVAAWVVALYLNAEQIAREAKDE